MDSSGNCKVDRCVICYTCSKEDPLAKIEIQGNGREVHILKKQLKVVFLLKKLFNIPEETCCQFLQQHGNPSSWIYWCYPCSVLVEEAKRLYDQVALFERKIDLLKKNLECKISSSNGNKIILGSTKCVEFKDKPTETVRSLILKNISSNELPGVSPAPVVVKLECDSTEQVPIAELIFEDESDSGDFPTVDDDNESRNSFNNSEEEKIHNDLELQVNSKSRIKTSIVSKPCQNDSRKITNAELPLATDKYSKENIYQCAFCSKIFSRKEKLRNHELTHPPPCPYCKEKFSERVEYKSHLMIHEAEEILVNTVNCVICQESFTEFDDVLNHQCNFIDCSDDSSSKKEKSKSVVSLKCSFCEKMFTHKRNLTAHLKSHEEPGRRPFKCSFCEKTYLYKRNLHDHEKVHTDNAHKCTVCDKILSSSQKLSSHMNTHTEENKKAYECAPCGKSFPYAMHLSKHNRIVHNGERKIYSCSFCEKKFVDKSIFTEHERVHTGEKPFPCSFCEERFSRKRALKVHIRRHTGEAPPFQCSICEKRFHSMSDTKRHEMTHGRDKPHSCSSCEKSFATSYQLSAHVKIHSGELLGRPFLCITCGKSFATSRYLRNHEKLHLGIRPYACQLCNMKFSKKSHLTDHEKIHSSGETSFACPVCDAQFKNNRTFKKHLATHAEDP